MRPRFLDRLGIDDRFAAFVLTLSLVVGCSIPLPPVPEPEPSPPVVTSETTIVVIEETSSRDFDTASVLGDITFWTSLGVKFRLYDDDSPDAVQYLPLVKDRPGMLIIDKRGQKKWSGLLPKTTDEIKRLIK